MNYRMAAVVRLLRAFVFFDLTVAQTDYSVGVCGDVEFVSDEDDRIAALMQP